LPSDGARKTASSTLRPAGVEFPAKSEHWELCYTGSYACSANIYRIER
jgi:hypothetical protein